VRAALHVRTADDELQTAVAAALHYDRRARQVQPGFGVALGRVMLHSSAAEDGSRDAVGEVVGSAPGVRDVVNRSRPGL
jgi:osmotically-inducible protein OsmY